MLSVCHVLGCLHYMSLLCCSTTIHVVLVLIGLSVVLPLCHLPCDLRVFIVLCFLL